MLAAPGTAQYNGNPKADRAKKIFVLHAPRQTGKTTCLLALMDYLNREGQYRCLYVNVEAAQAAREDVESAMKAILSETASRSRFFLRDQFVEGVWRKILIDQGPHAVLNEVLSLWSEQNSKPLVLLIDEIDALVGDTLISVLRQLRSGYDKRPRSFPQTIILCGVRDVRDYRIHSDKEKAIITGGSAFNIKAKSLRLGEFSHEDMIRLYAQHTEETRQVFEQAALDLAWELTRGQPWLVNALAYEVCFEMLQGVNMEQHVSQDDIQYVLDLGLVRRGTAGLEIANRIYREVVPRELTFITQLNFESRIQPAWYIGANGHLEIRELLGAFQEFFRENAESWLERFDYKKAGPQLLMQAFLQRIVNSGGRVEREYGLGRQRTDLLLIWPYPGAVQKVVIELKIMHDSLQKTITQGLEQTWAYMDKCGSEEGHLVIFDRTPDKPWEEKIFHRQETHGDKIIGLWGM